VGVAEHEGADHETPARGTRVGDVVHRRCGMAKILECGGLMPGCSFVAERKDMAEVMAKGAEHAKTAHGMTSIPPDLAAKVQAAIKDK